MDHRLAALNQAVAAAADAHLTDPLDAAVYGRLVSAVLDRRGYLSAPLPLPTDGATLPAFPALRPGPAVDRAADVTAAGPAVTADPDSVDNPAADAVAGAARTGRRSPQGSRPTAQHLLTSVYLLTGEAPGRQGVAFLGRSLDPAAGSDGGPPKYPSTARTPSAARASTRYIEFWSNQRRLHSSLG